MGNPADIKKAIQIRLTIVADDDTLDAIMKRVRSLCMDLPPCQTLCCTDKLLRDQDVAQVERALALNNDVDEYFWVQ